MQFHSVTRRELLKWLGLGASGVVLAACGQKAPASAPQPTAGGGSVNEPTAVPAIPAPQGATKVTLWTYPDDDIYFGAALDGFNEKYPDISVDIVKLDPSDLDQKLTAALVGGTGAPDMVDLEQGYIGKYGAQGGFVNLLDAPFLVNQYKEDLPKFAYDAGFSADGSKFFFVYYSTAPAVIHYRRSLFEQAGLSSDPDEVRKLICEDWTSYEAIGEKIAQPEGPWYIDYAGAVFDNYRNQYSPSWLTEDGKINIDNEDNLQGLQEALLVRQKGLDAKLSSWTPEWETSFKEAQVATYLSGDWLQGLIAVYGGEGTKGDWGMLPLPGSIGASNGGSTLAIPVQSPNKEAAWKYIEYFSFNVEPQMQMFIQTTCFPGYIPAWDDPRMQEPVEWYGGQKSRLISVEVAKEFSHRTYSKYDTQIGDIISVEIANVLDQGKDPAQALADAQSTAELQLEL